MSDDHRNEGKKPRDIEPAEHATDDPGRREFITETVPMITVGALVAAGLVSLSEEADAAGKRTVTLKVRLPENVELVTQIERVGSKTLALEVAHAKEHEARNLTLDLTTARTEQWLKAPRKGAFEGTACCVRG